MRRYIPHALALVVLLGFVPVSFGQGILIPTDRTLSPLALVDQRVKVALDDQVAITTVKQTFQNHAHRDLEATYTFTVPKGASVKEFSMMVNGKKVKGELVEAPKAKAIYHEIVRRTQDPGLLEYIGTDVLQMRVFPVPANGKQEIEVSFTSLANKQDTTVEYLYPMRTQSGLTRVQGEFAFEMELQSSGTIHSIYSPTHPISFVRKDDHHATISFDKSMAVLDRDVQIFYTTGKDDIGLTMLQHRPDSKDGYFLMLLAPRADLGADKRVPRDMVFVLDTSGSMSDDGKIDQAKRALKFGLSSLKSGDRFALMNFATSVNTWQSSLTDATPDNISAGKSWVDKLEATGGTAINDALLAALEMQHQDRSRSFTIVFITDGKPTVGECQIEKILANFDHKAKENTRIFTFGVGYDLDAAFLDRLAELHKGTSTYVRPKEDMEIKVSGFFSQIHQPVLTDLKLKATSGPKLVEIYPPQLPDLFYGSQLVVLGRYQGTGKIAIQLTGNVGTASKEFNYEVDLKDRPDAKAYVEDLWARRKVGYMLDQIRNNGEKKELVDEVISLAKKYGIATPYTSYLVVPDEAPHRFPADRPITRRGLRDYDGAIGGARGGLEGSGGGRGQGFGGGGLGGGGLGGQFDQQALKQRLDDGVNAKGRGVAAGAGAPPSNSAMKKWNSTSGALDGANKATEQAEALHPEFAKASPAIAGGGVALSSQSKQDQAGVELSIALNELKNQSQVTKKAQRSVLGRNLIDINGAWIDDQLKQETPKFEIKPMSNAYFKLLEKHPEMKEVLQLGNALVWISPSGTAIVINPKSDKEEASDEEIDKLFAAKK